MKAVIAVLALLFISSSWAKPAEDIEIEKEDSKVVGGYDNEVEDPCLKKRCSIGHECDLDEDGKPVCICARQCAEETQERAKVCSTKNVTFDSECELHRQKCLCHHKSEGCVDRSYRKAHLDYFGPCKEITECEDWELVEYPERMRDWLFNVMEELSRRSDLSKASSKILKEAEGQSKRWVLPVIWKFCDLDHTHDSTIDKDELMPITAPLKPLEHCTGPFLNKCDMDNSGDIDLIEWGTCLGLEDEEIQDRCAELRDD